MDLTASYLAGKGHRALSYDFRGHTLGDSDGELCSAECVVDDLRAAVEYVREALEDEAPLIVGHSMGGLAALVLAGSEERIRGVVAITVSDTPSAAFSSPIGAAMLAQRAGHISGVPAQRFVLELDALAARIGALEVPSLFVAARGDVLATPIAVRRLAERCGAYASVVEVDGSHLEAPDKARGAVGRWIAEL